MLSNNDIYFQNWFRPVNTTQPLSMHLSQYLIMFKFVHSMEISHMFFKTLDAWSNTNFDFCITVLTSLWTFKCILVYHEGVCYLLHIDRLLNFNGCTIVASLMVAPHILIFLCTDDNNCNNNNNTNNNDDNNNNNNIMIVITIKIQLPLVSKRQ